MSSATTTNSDDLKRSAALAAAELVTDGMLLGLGTGSTAAHVVAAIGERLREGNLRGVRGVPTSLATVKQATAEGIELVELPASGLDLAIDGMDELDPALNATKGLGGALLREKIVAAAAKRFVLIGDDSKLVDHLGQRAPIPVEVVRFGWRRTLAALESVSSRAVLREVAGAAFVTDNGNHVIDCHFSQPFVPAELARSLADVPGVAGHGLFLGLVAEAYIAYPGGVRRHGRSS